MITVRLRREEAWYYTGEGDRDKSLARRTEEKHT